MELLKVENVSKRYSGHTALDDVSLTVKEGSIYGLLGPNGAGKTTLIRIINHITAPDNGRVIFDGHQLTEKDVTSIGYLPEERGLYKKMKVGEQAVFFARLKGLSRHDAVNGLKEWFEKFDILPWWDKKVEELSKGMAQKVQFIVTILHHPKLLIFDEPFSGFDPINADLLKNEILNLRQQGATIVFSTHNMGSVEELCDDITLINQSHNILSGSVEDVRRTHSSGRFRISFNGDEAKLLEALGHRMESYKFIPSDIQGKSLSLILHDENDMREVISIANDTVQITALNREIPSMDEIFIQTVKTYNAGKS